MHIDPSARDEPAEDTKAVFVCMSNTAFQCVPPHVRRLSRPSLRVPRSGLARLLGARWLATSVQKGARHHFSGGHDSDALPFGGAFYAITVHPTGVLAEAPRSVLGTPFDVNLVLGPAYAAASTPGALADAHGRKPQRAVIRSYRGSSHFFTAAFRRSGSLVSFFPSKQHEDKGYPP